MLIPEEEFAEIEGNVQYWDMLGGAAGFVVWVLVGAELEVLERLEEWGNPGDP